MSLFPPAMTRAARYLGVVLITVGDPLLVVVTWMGQYVGELLAAAAVVAALGVAPHEMDARHYFG